jgi:hypothetical protein
MNPLIVELIAVFIVLGILGYLLAVRSKTQDPNVVRSLHAQHELELDSQRKSLDFQRKEISRLERLNLDMDQQIRDLLKRDAVSPEEKADYSRMKRDFDSMEKEVNKIGMYFRQNRQREIDMGEHANKTWAEICIRYMQQGQAQKNREAIQ